jgi:hypothetical protein
MSHAATSWTSVPGHALRYRIAAEVFRAPWVSQDSHPADLVGDTQLEA